MSRIRNLLLVGAVLLAACGTTSEPTTTIPSDTTVPNNSNDVIDGGDGIMWRVVNPTGDALNPQPITSGELISVEDNVVRVGIYMGVEPCSVIDRVEVAETADSVDITIFAGTGDAAATCIAIAEARAVVVTLDAPLGDRTLTLAGAPLS